MGSTALAQTTGTVKGLAGYGGFNLAFYEAPPTPQDLSGVVSVAVSASKIYALLQNGQLVRWGVDNVPSVVLANCSAIRTYQEGCVAILKDQTVLLWTDSRAAYNPFPGEKIRDAAYGTDFGWTGSAYAWAVTMDGRILVAWVSGVSGYTPPAPQGKITNALAVACGNGRAMALLANHTVVFSTEFGLGQSGPLSLVSQISASSSDMLVLLESGTLLRLGKANSPQVELGPNVRQIVAGREFDLVVFKDGTVRKVGNVGQVGPVDVETLRDVSSVALGDYVGWLAVVEKPAVPPQILEQPSLRRVSLGNTADLSVVVAGPPPVTYQWYRETTAILRATDSLLRLPHIGPTQAGDYTVVACNPFGCTTSAVIQVKILDASTPRIWSASTLDNGGPGSLRELILDANASAGGTILLPNLRGEIRLVSPLPHITSPVTIQGPGTNLLRITGTNLDNGLLVDRKGECHLSDIEFSGFVTTSASNGAAIYNEGMLELTRCVLARNSTAGSGAAIYSSGSLQMTECMVVSNLTIAPHQTDSVGAGVSIKGGEMKALRCSFVGNRSQGLLGEVSARSALESPIASRGGTAWGGGIAIVKGQCTLEECIISKNTSQGGGYGGHAIGGGLYFNGGGLLKLRRCLFAENSAIGGEDGPGSFKESGVVGGMALGGGLHVGTGLAFIDSTTISKNIARRGQARGYAGFAIGGGIYASNAVLTAVNTTLSGNQTEAGDTFISSIFCYAKLGNFSVGAGACLREGTFSFLNCTITENQCVGGQGGLNQCSANKETRGGGWGAGLAVGYGESANPLFRTPARMMLGNTIIAGNTFGPGPIGAPDVFGVVESLGHNLIGDTNGTIGIVNGDLWGISADLGPLQDNGSGILTHIPKPGSRAIDAGSSSVNPSVDQLGKPRPAGAGVDIGAVETQVKSSNSAPFLILGPTSQDANVGTAVSIQVVAGGTPPLQCQWEKDGADLDGATNLWLTLPSPTSFQNGSYRLRIRNAFGSLRTQPVTLQLRLPPIREEWRLANSSNTYTFQRIVYGNKTFVAHGYTDITGGSSIGRLRGAIYTSKSPETWEEVLPLLGVSFGEIAFSEGQFLVEIKEGYSDPRISPCACTRVGVSTNGIDWSLSELPYTNQFTALIGVPGGFLASAASCCGANEVVWISHDLTLRVQSLGLGDIPYRGAYRDGITVLNGKDGTVYQSTDRLSWVRGKLPFPDYDHTKSLLAWGDRFLALSSSPFGSVISTSKDGLTWESSVQVTNQISVLAAGPAAAVGYFLNLSSEPRPNNLLISLNKTNWSRAWTNFVPPLFGKRIRDMVYADGRVVGVGDAGTVLISKNFEMPELQLDVVGGGTIEVFPNAVPHSFGETVQLLAKPGPWDRFVRWSDWNTNNPRTITLDSVNDYTALFTPTAAVETLTFGGVSREAPIGTPAIIVDGILQTQGAITKLRSTQIDVFTSITNARLVWTVDGSAPSPDSPPTPKHFTLKKSALIRLTAFNQGQPPIETTPVRIEVQPGFTLSTRNRGGGTLRLIPSDGIYPANTQVKVEVTAWPGWQFMGWNGGDALPGTSFFLTLDRDKYIEPVFGTTVSFSPSSYGTSSATPTLQTYPYDQPIVFRGTPNPGFVFVFWPSYALSNSTENPLIWRVRSQISQLEPAFSKLLPGVVALTRRTEGAGRIAVTPSHEAFALGTDVSIEAIPDDGQTFLGWIGDLSGATAETSILMDANKTVTARFTQNPVLKIEWNPENPDRVEFLVGGELGAKYVIETLAKTWTPLIHLTNSFGEMRIRQPIKADASYQWYRARQE